MHQSIRYLEAMGQNPSLMSLSASQLEQVMDEMFNSEMLGTGDGEPLTRIASAGRDLQMATVIWAPGEDPYARPGEEPAGDFIPVENYRSDLK